MASRERSPLPLSRTCQNCAHAKIKCHRTQNLPVCDRCNRLNKECIFRQARRRNNGTKKDHRIEALEAKVNELLGARSTPGTRSGSPEQRDGTDQPPAILSAAPGNSTARSSLITGPMYADSNTNASDRSFVGNDVIDIGLLTMERARALISNFKTALTPHFPFVVVAQHIAAEELRKDKPFLFLAILAAASYEDVLLQKALDSEVKKSISTRMFLDGQISFELLQGLLVHLAWCQYHSRPRRYSQLLGLAVSIIVDLRLDRPPQAKSWKSGPGINPNDTVDGSLTKSSWGRDVHRAVAGCYYLSSSVSVVLEKAIMFQYSAYIEDCCESLRQKAEYPTDRYLLYIIQLQQLLGKINHHSVEHCAKLIDPDPTIELYITSFRFELEVFKERMPFSMSENQLLGMLFHTVELYLYQICLFDIHRRSRTTRPIPWSSWRLEVLSAGLISAKSLLGYYLSLPIGTESSFNNSELIQIGFALTVAAKLSIAASDNSVSRETRVLRESLDISSILKQVVLRVGTLVTPHRDKENVFYNYERRVKQVQTWYEGHFSKEPPANGRHELGVGVPTIHDAVLPDTMFDLQFANFYSDATFDEMMGGWMPDPMGPL
ncbi:hypothetical protein AOQ84DRAFT_407445 [Glonium stellatum]|uniref:Zn(2)-C6 fungal-type domain-containing protein n=1 Tax=Glonium stellatum TaxID=574774 RepID=A0A8E2JSV3_9PEZI|nr:hypothetical protein AOQ84DRAFT_407445 [Glonium stellatum]